MLDAHSGCAQANARRLVPRRGIEPSEVDAILADALERLRARDGFGNQRFDNVPRDAAIAAREGLPAGFRRVVERVQGVKCVGAIARKRVRPRAEPAALLHH